GNGVRALAGLGVAARSATRGAPIRSQQLCDRRGRVLADLGMADLWQDVGECVGTTRAELHAALREDLTVPVRFGVTVRSLTTDSGGVDVVFTDGGGGRYDVVVGADGIRSGLRALIRPQAGPRFLGQASWRFLTDDPCGIDRWTVWLGCGLTFLAYPVGGGRVCCYADRSTRTRPAAAGGQAAGDARLADLFAGFDPRVGALLATPAAAEPHRSPVEEVPDETWTDGRVVLIGDAAHAASPNMAQGVAMAVEDALVLAETLAADQDPLTRLQRYRARRLPRTRWVRQQTRRRDRTRGMPAVLRDTLLRHGARNLYERG
ncbi:FAD-dependent monooxygenase, partial [Streptomyces sparsus]